ncbi:2-hydroxy-6-oxonona-2,4-dienedioate hydrolase/4,5:9,10-diseco-3-hydroxy-5,9,17-trioxoandrosta-1(10),2-diene-4-oate hydrolase [Streptomyces brevispora]|uniref:2-hydroxy-6-oxonona-2,4-dienedioate hydrolase/4,5:9,10-diseco-3-hydroxy-5,9, 17-trioxoandrosta-1(10),2-diene-4-oate hydrolase n=1 Tax=Streptomyces brevispora TaxID=887462 RepID=A0A561UUB2_9ACTN|nr:alpha/beta hydrolase [Streptomyces brevispora]TWG02937.1 2-hydroxy-6-oxonona-2,4-dienedioate hydrolase/4,5:9,10-diseco-3-hydroxy-5,9,17-trioxoandrosta-1(10),2-diene-4-oate hydrolase [Streptomyces brevispora]
MTVGIHEPLTRESTSRFVTVDGTRIHYHEAGTGPEVLLCVHGGAPGASGWGNFGTNLAELSRHARVLVVDLPGYGRSDAIELSGGKYRPYADVFAAMLSELGIARASVVGLATNGAVAMALHHAERVDRLVLVSSAGGVPLFSTMPSEAQKAIRSYYAGEGPSREKMRAYLRMMMFDPGLVTDELVEERYQESVAGGEERRAGAESAGVPAEPLRQELGRIAVPTLVVWGTENRVQGFDNALFLLKQIPDAQLHLFKRTGLWVPHERASEFTSLVLGFLAERTSGPAAA